MRRHVRFGALAAVAVVASACASTGSSAVTPAGTAAGSTTAAARGDGAVATSAPRRKDANVLRRTEVSEAQLNLSVFEVVQQERPRFLSAGAHTVSGNALWVYVDGTQVGRAEELRNMRMSEVDEIRYLSGSEATNRFGTGHLGGAILVKRRR